MMESLNEKTGFHEKTKEVLINELTELQRRITALEREKEALQFRSVDEDEKFWNVIKSVPVGVHMYRLEPDGRLLFIGTNPAADRILGVDNRQFVGKTLEEAFPALAATEVSERYRRAAAHGEAWKTEQMVYEDDQVHGAYEVHAFQTSPNTMIATFTEVTQRKRMEIALRESETRYRTLFESAGDAIFILDAEPDNMGRIVDANRAAAEMHGYSKEELLSLNISDLDTPEAAKEIPERIRRMVQGETLKSEVNHVRKDGTVFPVEISAGLLHLENHNYIFAFDRDITARKEAAAALKESSERIENFAYTISHDLKNPAVALTGLTRLLKRRYDHVLDESGINICDRIMQSSDEIAHLVESINAFIVTKESPLHVELIDPGEVLATVRSEFGAALRRRRIQWQQADEMSAVRADKLCLLRVFRNLVDNALKHGGDSLSRIEFAYGESDEFHFFAVSNDGVGIDPEERKTVFSVFKRQEASRAIEGAGLGLAIVKEVAERHRGYVWAESDVSQGITFHIAISKTL